MDRLICGDVGYGKTEIAVRAAFKAVQDGRQVVVLAPTTLLAAQHYATFSERYAPFPVIVRPLSRFQSDKEVAETLAGLAEGKVDVVIGTHRLLSPETRFDRLGLVIIDEEQRFGVEQKEYLKQLRTEVDVLSMSATPDPAHAGDGDLRHPGDVHHPDPARGAPPGADLGRPLRREADRGRHPARAAPRRAGVLRPQPGVLDQPGRRADRRAGPGGPGRRRARADERAHAREDHGRVRGARVRRPGLDHDRRVRAGHPERQHADRGPGRRLRPARPAPAARPGRAAAASAATPTSCTRRRSR